jgi:hypothetical protein
MSPLSYLHVNKMREVTSGRTKSCSGSQQIEIKLTAFTTKQTAILQRNCRQNLYQSQFGGFPATAANSQKLRTSHHLPKR